MTVLVDTSVLIDHLRGVPEATETLLACRRRGPLHASEITRLEVLAGMRSDEEVATTGLLRRLEWLPVTAAIADEGGRLGRRWLPSHPGIDSADLAIAGTAMVHDLELVTANVRHFPMFADLRPPY